MKASCPFHFRIRIHLLIKITFSDSEMEGTTERVKGNDE